MTSPAARHGAFVLFSGRVARALSRSDEPKCRVRDTVPQGFNPPIPGSIYPCACLLVFAGSAERIQHVIQPLSTALR